MNMCLHLAVGHLLIQFHIWLAGGRFPKRGGTRGTAFYIACQMQFDVLVRSLHCARHLEEIVSLLVAMLP